MSNSNPEMNKPEFSPAQESMFQILEALVANEWSWEANHNSQAFQSALGRWIVWLQSFDFDDFPNKSAFVNRALQILNRCKPQDLEIQADASDRDCYRPMVLQSIKDFLSWKIQPTKTLGPPRSENNDTRNLTTTWVHHNSHAITWPSKDSTQA